jgi:hypothetical protein
LRLFHYRAERVLGFFSFTEVTDPGGHAAYNEWHQFDHLPEQFSLEGIVFGQRWVASPRCQGARAAVGPLLRPVHYMTLYLLRDADVLPEFFALADRLRAANRFFADRISHLSGAFTVTGRWAAPRISVSAAAVPYRPSAGIYVIVGPPVDGTALVAHAGVAGAWQFTDQAGERHITVAFLDGDPLAAAAPLGSWCLGLGHTLEWAGPLEGIDANRWDWFDRLTGP